MNDENILEETIKYPLTITQKLVYPRFECVYNEEYDIFCIRFYLDKNKAFNTGYGLELLDVLLDDVATQQVTCDVPLVVTKQDLDLIYSLELKNPIIDLDKSDNSDKLDSSDELDKFDHLDFSKKTYQ